jgi:hypothetical protein
MQYRQYIANGVTIVTFCLNKDYTHWQYYIYIYTIHCRYWQYIYSDSVLPIATVDCLHRQYIANSVKMLYSGVRPLISGSQALCGSSS